MYLEKKRLTGSRCHFGVVSGVSSKSDALDVDPDLKYKSTVLQKRAINKACKCCRCATACPEGRFKCANLDRCIPERWVCDGDNDCGDLSDEQNCGGSRL